MLAPMTERLLLTAEQIAARVASMAGEIRRDFPHDVHLVGVLNRDNRAGNLAHEPLMGEPPVGVGRAIAKLLTIHGQRW